MTQDEIIEMVRDAGLDWHKGWTLEDGEPNRFEIFAKLVAQHTLANIDPSKFISFQEGVEAGRLAEREEIAQFIERTNLGSLPDETALHYAQLLKSYSTSIRARGEA